MSEIKISATGSIGTSYMKVQKVDGRVRYFRLQPVGDPVDGTQPTEQQEIDEQTYYAEGGQ